MSKEFFARNFCELIEYFSEEVRKLIDLAYSNNVEDKREAINKINQLEARFEYITMNNIKHLF
jgi:hypothetical protein